MIFFGLWFNQPSKRHFFLLTQKIVLGADYLLQSLTTDLVQLLTHEILKLQATKYLLQIMLSVKVFANVLFKNKTFKISEPGCILFFILLLWHSWSFSKVYLVIKSEAQLWNKTGICHNVAIAIFTVPKQKIWTDVRFISLHVNIWTRGQVYPTLCGYPGILVSFLLFYHMYARVFIWLNMGHSTMSSFQL